MISSTKFVWFRILLSDAFSSLKVSVMIGFTKKFDLPKKLLSAERSLKSLSVRSLKSISVRSLKL